MVDLTKKEQYDHEQNDTKNNKQQYQQEGVLLNNNQNPTYQHRPRQIQPPKDDIRDMEAVFNESSNTFSSFAFSEEGESSGAEELIGSRRRRKQNGTGEGFYPLREEEEEEEEERKQKEREKHGLRSVSFSSDSFVQEIAPSASSGSNIFRSEKKREGGGGGGGKGEEQQQEDNDNKSSSSSTITSPKSRIQNMQYRCGQIVNDDKIQFLMIIFITINAIMMGLATFNIVSKNPTAADAFETVDLVFLIIFTVELVLHFIHRGVPNFFYDGWLVFDLIIIFLSWSLSGFQIVRAFRIFRALRLVTRVKTLRDLITALLDVIPRMAAITCLLLLLFYIFAVLFTTLFKDLYKDGVTEVNYFGRLDFTFLTLLQIMTLDDWASIARECEAVYSWAPAIFNIFVSLSAFIVYNLIIAVVCDAVAMVDQNLDDDEEPLAKAMRQYEHERADDDNASSSPTGPAPASGEVSEQPQSTGGDLRLSSLPDVQEENILSLMDEEQNDSWLSADQQVMSLQAPVSNLVKNQRLIDEAMDQLLSEVQVLGIVPPVS